MERTLTTFGNCFQPSKSNNFEDQSQNMPVFKQHLHYLGHLILEQDINLLLDKIMAIANLVEPKKC